MPRTASASSILERQLEGLLHQGKSIDEFVDWFIHHLWTIERDGSEDEIRLSAAINNRLAERSGGYATDTETIEGLRVDAREHGLAWALVAQKGEPLEIVGGNHRGAISRLNRTIPSPLMLNMEWHPR